MCSCHRVRLRRRIEREQRQQWQRHAASALHSRTNSTDALTRDGEDDLPLLTDMRSPHCSRQPLRITFPLLAPCCFDPARHRSAAMRLCSASTVPSSSLQHLHFPLSPLLRHPPRSSAPLDRLWRSLRRFLLTPLGDTSLPSHSRTSHMAPRILLYRSSADFLFVLCFCASLVSLSLSRLSALSPTTSAEFDSAYTSLLNSFQSLLEHPRFDSCNLDISLSDGVLSVVSVEKGTWVLNKHAPTRQMWLSSPVSGPRKFNLHRGNSNSRAAEGGGKGKVGEEWRGERDESDSLKQRLIDEWREAFQVEIDPDADFQQEHAQ